MLRTNSHPEDTGVQENSCGRIRTGVGLIIVGADGEINSEESEPREPETITYVKLITYFNRFRIHYNSKLRIFFI